MYIECFDKISFRYPNTRLFGVFNYNITASLSDPYLYQAGLKEYYFANYYEVMFWYTYYKCKYHNVKRRMDYKDGHSSWKNRAYMSVIPTRYIKKFNINKVREYYLERHNGVPSYYKPDLIKYFFTVK